MRKRVSGGQIVEEVVEPRVHQGQQALDARKPLLVGEVGNDLAHLGRRNSELRGQKPDAVGDVRQCFRVQDRLPRGQQNGFGDGTDAALIGGREKAQGVHPLPEQLDAQGVCVQRREHVHDAAPHAEIARLLDDGRAQVTARDQLGDQAVAVDLLPFQNQLGILVDRLFRDELLEQRLHRRDDDGRGGVHQQLIKDADALGCRFIVIGQKLERQQVIGREIQHRERRRPAEKEQVLHQAPGLFDRVRHHQHGHRTAKLGPGNQIGARTAAQPAAFDGTGAPREDFGQCGGVNCLLILIHKRSR